MQTTYKYSLVTEVCLGLFGFFFFLIVSDCPIAFQGSGHYGLLIYLLQDSLS